MSAKILDGKKVADECLLELRDKLVGSTRKPTLVIYQIGDDAASAVYVRNKTRAAEKVGILAITRKFAAESEKCRVLAQLRLDARDPEIDGIMVQLPLPLSFSAEELINQIPPEKDVDGLTVSNAGKLTKGMECHLPCTAQGIVKLLDSYGIGLDGKHVVVVGRSEIVGKPVAQLALNRNATVSICHSHTQNLPKFTSAADVLIVAVGKPELIGAPMIKEGATVVDVGINREVGGRLVGDVDFNTVKEVAGAITPVPGGIGPMTVAMLMNNTVNAYLAKNL